MSTLQPSRPGIKAETLRNAGIRFSDLPERGSIEIPYYDLQGHSTGFCRWRLPRERATGQKYHQEVDSGTRAYFPPQFHTFAPGGDLVIVEGEFKALCLIDAGIKAIGLPNFNTYERDESGTAHLLPGIADAIDYAKPSRILFLGDSDTATNFEFARNAVFLGNAVNPLVVALPRIPIGGPGKGIDDCRHALRDKFQEFWCELVDSAVQIDLRAGAGALAARLLEREADPIKASAGIERDKLIRRIVELALKCRKEPLAKDRIVAFTERNLKISRTAFKEAVIDAGLARDHETSRQATAVTGSCPESGGVIGSDAMPAGERGSPESASLFPHPPATAWASAVDGTTLLDDLAAVLRRFVILPAHAADTLALFILETYSADCFDAAPYVNLASPVKRCGKTLTLRMLSLLCDRALPSANCSEASVFRALHSEHPCLLIDEVDTFFADKPQLRGILNSGNVRADAAVMRTVEVRRGGTTDFEVRRYSTFGPKVFSGIGRLADTLADRSIVIPMRRKRPDESCLRFRRREFDGEPLRQQCRRWADDHATYLTASQPVLPQELNDRAADLWEPLLAVADTAGGEWPERARAAALALSGDNPELAPVSLCERLLADIHTLFDRVETDRFSSIILCKRLIALEEAPWAEVRKGHPINPNKLASLLKNFGVHSRKVRTSRTETAQGYDRQDFDDAWKRYIPSVFAASKWNNGTKAVDIGENAVFDVEPSKLPFHPKKPLPPNDDGACSIVPLQNAPSDGKRTDLVEELV